MFKYFKSLMSNEEGYGTVELLLIVAGIGLLATGLFTTLNKRFVEDNDSTTNQVVDKIGTWVDGWFEADPK